MRIELKATLLLVTAVVATGGVRAAGLDLHWLWDDRCADCHGHSGDFARESLSVSGNELRGRHHARDLHRFMRNHYLAGQEVDAIYAMLLAQVETPARFKTECAGCHATAARFVRGSLEWREGALYGRDSRQPVRAFLAHHRSLNRADIEFFMNLLTRVAREVYRPRSGTVPSGRSTGTGISQPQPSCTDSPCR